MEKKTILKFELKLAVNFKNKIELKVNKGGKTEEKTKVKFVCSGVL